MNSIAAILLAAGAGSRMGATKQLLRIDGQSLVRRAAAAALDAGCASVTVVTGSNSDAVLAEISDLPVQIAFNLDWPTGIGTSIRRGLSAVLTNDPSIAAVILMLCDQPHLDSKAHPRPGDRLVRRRQTDGRLPVRRHIRLPKLLRQNHVRPVVPPRRF